MGTPRRRAVVNAVANWPVFTPQQRARILRWAGVHCGLRVEIEAGFRIANDRDLWLGEGCYINHDVYIDCLAEVHVGANSGMAHGAQIITSHHNVKPASEDRLETLAEPRAVTIGSRVGIGAGAIILPGVTVADRCVIGANSLLAKDTEPDGVYLGVPARRIREI
jgi:acetyltransferase-like isoleucine patch superfamily enzyme